MSKYAYLIIAHNEFEILKAQLRMLDYPDNDIFLHIDKKVKNVPTEDLKNSVKFSKLYILDKPVSVAWGDFSVVESTLRLLEASLKGHYDYYHLLSGVDLPIKSQEAIHNFFDSCGGKEFVHFDAEKIDENNLDRVKKYWLFKDKKNKNLFKKILNKMLLSAQFFVDRVKKSNLTYQKGANWFSITYSLAKYVVENRELIEKTFKYTLASDEMFLQTLVASSDFINNLYMFNNHDDYKAIMREIDWNRGNPYIYRSQDYEMLMSSDKMFARKFSYNVDSDIVKMIEKSVLG